MVDESKTGSVNGVAVVSAGLMGSSIAQIFAAHGIEVNLVDVNEKALLRALGLVESGLQIFVDAGRIASDEVSRRWVSGCRSWG
jgi:3-hydroxybutyryl-CoA dehydrogenase